MNTNSKLTIVNGHLNYDNVSLIAPSTHTFIHLAAVIDTASLPFFLSLSKRKKQLIQQCKQWCQKLAEYPDVVEATVFKALLIPPGRGELLHERTNKALISKFDLAILIEVKSEAFAAKLKQDATFLSLQTALEQAAQQTHFVTASNARRIGPVDHNQPGVFLFNYFYADDVQQNLAVWKYTAGWFEKETHLNNSTLLLPLPDENSSYSVINHCRWDKLRDILPSLIFKKTFQQYVLDNFYANQVAAMPILYQLA